MQKLIICWLIVFFSLSLSAIENLSYGETKTFASKALSAQREYYIHLPDSYQMKNNQRYPVLYLLHGQWDLLSAVAAVDLIADEIPELIIVGIQSQGKELRPVKDIKGNINIHAKQFTNFLIKELIPHIQESYRVADYKVLSGHSNAGRFVLNTLVDYPEKFNGYFAFSPSLEDNYINQNISKALTKLQSVRTTLVVTLANEGEHMQVPYRKLVNMLTEKSKNITFLHQKFPQQSHSVSKFNALTYSLNNLFKGWVPSRKIQLEGLTSLKKHYAQLTQHYGFQVEIPLLNILRLTFMLSISDDESAQRKVEALVSYALERKPEDIQEFEHIVEVMNNEKHSQAAKQLIKLLCSKQPEYKICI